MPKPQEGFVYLMASELGLTKIGFSKNPERRARILRDKALGEISVIWREQCVDAPLCESLAHQKFSALRRMGEWFELSTSDIEAAKNFIRNAKGETR